MRLVCMLALLVGCHNEVTAEAAPLLPIQAEPALVESLSDEIRTSAVLEAERWQPLYFQQGGLISMIAVTEGEPVKAGQRLATLDLDYQDNQVALAKLQVEAAELDLQQATHDLEQARLVAASGGYSDEQVRDREQRVLEAGLDLKRQQLNLNGQRIKRDQMILYAPFDGLISEMNLQLGERVQGDVSDPDNDRNARPPMAVHQPGRFQARLSLPEGQARRIAPGDPAQIALMEDPAITFPGTIAWIAPAVDRDSRTVAMRLVCALQETDPAYARVRDGSTVRVVVLASSGGTAEVVTVPEQAVVYSNDKAYLFVTDGQVAERVEVVTGRIRQGRIEIRSGIAAGAQVVTTQVYQLSSGQPVRVLGGAEL